MKKIVIKTKEECLVDIYTEHPEYKTDENIQKNLTEGHNDILNYLPDGIFDRKWELARIVNDENDVGDIGDYVTKDGWVINPSFVKEVIDEPDFVVEKTENGFRISKNELVMDLTGSQFWEIIRFGEHFDVLCEVENYLDELENSETCFVNGVSVKEFRKITKTITEEVISDRISEENGNQIYFVLEALANKIKAGTSFE